MADRWDRDRGRSGVFDRRQAMQELGAISYGELLDRIAARGLPLPRVSKEQEDAIVERLDAVLARR
jgi:hypothetical protein